MHQLLRLLRLGLCRARQVPVVEVARAGRQVRRKRQPAQVRQLQPRGRLVDGAPGVGQPAVEAEQRDNVGRGLDGPLGEEEEGHPRQVEAQLDRVHGQRVLGRRHGGRRGERREARGGDPVRGVAHETAMVSWMDDG